MISRRRRNKVGGRKPHQPPLPQGSPSSVPKLVKTGSESSSSGDSPPYHRSQQKSHSGKCFGMNHRRCSSGSLNPVGRPGTKSVGNRGRAAPPRNNSRLRSKRRGSSAYRDSSVLKGAEILRREISDGARPRPLDQQPSPCGHDDIWDPWRAPSDSFVDAAPLERRQEEISDLTLSVEDAAYWAQQPSLGHQASLVRYNQQQVFEDVSPEEEEDYGGQVPPQQHHLDCSDANEKDSMNVIEKAMSLLGASMSLPKECQSVPPIVQRVSDLDDNKSFASMFASSYLPNQLFSGSLLNGSNKKDEEEMIETSTLDYIASLYTSKAERAKGERERQGTKHLVQESRTDRPVCTRRITAAAAPFERMVAPSSFFYSELLRDPAYQHALQAGALWQSLCSQHVRFPALWWDGKEPASPPLGTPEKQPWTYLGRHRVVSDRKLNTLIGNRGSSGRILLHLVVRDDVTCEPFEDICCGCFHPNARGVRTTAVYDPKVESCRDVWIGHRKRFQSNSSSTLASMLQRQNRNRVFASPLGGPRSNTSDIQNSNLKAVFGERPPLFTVFVTESEIFELIRSESNTGSPVSVILLRRFLRYRIG